MCDAADASSPRAVRLARAQAWICLDRDAFPRKQCIKICKNKWFDHFILACILTNCLFLALSDPSASPLYAHDEIWNAVLFVGDLAFTAIFCVEMLLKPAASVCTTPATCTDFGSTASVRCCTTDGSSCQSNVPGCTNAATYAEAEAICAAFGRRLCTPDEATLCCGTGCGHDNRMVWTSESCAAN